jgi:Asp-tRNA(Asn)/Glu-tRNA(Gln) amidotransferase A subunit family amidase
VLTVPFDMMSSHPLLSAPSGRARDAMPAGLQIFGQGFRESGAFRAGPAFDVATPWPEPAAIRQIAA